MSFLKTIFPYLPSDSICAEIGVLRGDFSEKILTVLKPKTFYLIDPWSESAETYGKDLNFLKTAYSTNEDYSIVHTRFLSEISNKQVIIKRKFSYDSVNDFPDNFFDFIYIDSCHLYSCIKKDLTDYLPKLKSNGLMCGHDYTDFDEFGVIQAVDEFIQEYNFRFLTLEDTHWALKQNN